MLAHIKMKQLITFIFALVVSNVYSQYTQKYIDLVKPLSKIETEIDTILYSNDKPKFITVRTKFEYDGGIIKTNIGTSYVFYRNGRIARKTEIDDYGNYLNEKLFDRKGNLIEERITTEIDNRAINLEDYLYEKSYGDFTKKINYYKYSNKIKNWYKHKEEVLILKEGEFNETMNFLDESGTVIKTKKLNYKE